MAHSFVQSQELLGIKVEPQQVGVGETVSIGIDFKPYGNNTICGIEVNFGDGTSEYVRIEENKLPIRLSHTYAKAGTVVIQAEGKTRFQGIYTSFSCQGGSKSTAVVVRPDDYAAKLAAEQAAKQAALRQAEADRQAAEAAATTARVQREQAEQSANRAKSDRQAVDQSAQRAAQARAAAERKAQVDARAAALQAQPKAAPAPQAAPPAPVAPVTKPSNPKANSALDL